MFKILFLKENFLTVLRTVSSLFWLFVLPGFSLMYYWNENLDFLERLIIGIALSAALIGVTGYNLGLLGLHIRYHGIVLPVVCFGVSYFLIKRKKPIS